MYYKLFGNDASGNINYRVKTKLSILLNIITK